MTLPLNSGNITVDAMRVLCESYCSERKRGHMVMSGMVYLSQPTEYGTLYSLDELSAIKGEYTREIDFGTVI